MHQLEGDWGCGGLWHRHGNTWTTIREPTSVHLVMVRGSQGNTAHTPTLSQHDPAQPRSHLTLTRENLPPVQCLYMYQQPGIVAPAGAREGGGCVRRCSTSAAEVHWHYSCWKYCYAGVSDELLYRCSGATAQWCSERLLSD